MKAFTRSTGALFRVSHAVAGVPAEPLAVQEWRNDLADARLDGARVLRASEQRDRLPGEQANMVYAQLLRGKALIMASAGLAKYGSLNLRSRDAQLLDSLLMAGEHYNRWTRHNGMPGERLPEHLHVQAIGRKDLCADTTQEPGVGTRRLRTTSRIHEPPQAVVAHEGVHEAQFNVSHEKHPLLCQPLSAAQEIFEEHPRARHLETSRCLPTGLAPVERPDFGEDAAAAHHETYAAQPMELQALLEEAAVAGWFARPDSAHIAQPFAQGCGMEHLGSLLIRAAGLVNTAVPGEMFEGAEVVARYDSRKHPQAPECVERILFFTAALDEAMKSRPWTGTDAALLKSEMDALALRLRPPQDLGKSGTAHLQDIATTLERFLERLVAAKGRFALLTSRESPPGRVDQDKARPVSRLEQVIEAVPRGYGFYPASRLADALMEAKERSGFLTGVASLQEKISLSRGAAPDAAELADVVMRLASLLMGVDDFRRLPAPVRPEIALYDPASEVFPAVPGMTAPLLPHRASNDDAPQPPALSSRQKHKAMFDPVAWQLRVPRRVFEEPDRLPSCLARLAGDLAYCAAAFMAHGDRWTGYLAAGAAGAWEPTTLPRIASLLCTTVKPLSDEFIAKDRRSAAAALRLLVQATEHRDVDKTWHQGPRAEVKSASQDGPAGRGAASHAGSMTDGEAQAARAAYASRSLQRWRLPAVAFRRALAAGSKDFPAMPAEALEDRRAEESRLENSRNLANVALASKGLGVQRARTLLAKVRARPAAHAAALAFLAKDFIPDARWSPDDLARGYDLMFHEAASVRDAGLIEEFGEILGYLARSLPAKPPGEQGTAFAAHLREALALQRVPLLSALAEIVDDMASTQRNSAFDMLIEAMPRLAPQGRSAFAQTLHRTIRNLPHVQRNELEQRLAEAAGAALEDLRGDWTPDGSGEGSLAPSSSPESPTASTQEELSSTRWTLRLSPRRRRSTQRPDA